MRRLAGTALICSSGFIALVALLSDAPALFYMGTALLATIATARLQAYLSVRGLVVTRFAPNLARVGEQVKVELVVKSERRIRRPLIFVKDLLPPSLLIANRKPSLPVAPDFTFPVRSEYSFKPRRRGIYRWAGVEAVGTDALGLVTMTRAYITEEVEMTVLPIALPVSIDLPSAAGWGVSEASTGDQKGPGGEPRGIREYISGDSLRHVHWRSSARTGTLQVKEFEAGSHSQTAVFFQLTKGSDLIRESDLKGEAPVFSSLDLMVGHALHLIENQLRQGSQVFLPQAEAIAPKASADRRSEVALMLADLQATSQESVSDAIAKALDSLPRGCLVLACLVRPDPDLPRMASRLRERNIQLVALLYDADAFIDASTHRKTTSSERKAASIEFVEALRSVGCHPVLMPIVRGAA